MAEPAVATPPVAEEPPKVEEKQPTKPLLDSSKPLRGQVDKLLSQLPPEEGKDDKSAEEEPKKGTEGEVEEPKKEEPATPEPTPEAPKEDESEPESHVELKELPPWQKYILDNLPQMQTLGHVGENGKDKVYTIKRVEDLPDNFEFASKRDELAFSAALASQEVNARELMTRYNNEQQQQQYQRFQEQEAVDIQKDINSLQKEGIIDKFKYAEDAPEFNDDPAVKMANEIYDLYKKTNDSYLKEGRTYRITYQDAAYKYLGMRSRQAPPKAPDNSKEREKIAEKVSAPQSAAPGEQRKTMPPGSSMQDILKLYKLGRI
jgi:hypothetical protein